VAALLGPASPLAYVIAAVVVTLIVACFAEAGSMFERTGGPYLYAREAFGRFIGFEVGWMFLLSRLAADAAISNAFTSYLGYFRPELASGTGRFLSITMLFVALTWINLVGIRYGAWAVNLLTVAKLVPLALFIGVGLPAADHGSYRLISLPTAAEIDSLRQASLLLVFAFGGFENASVPTEEVKEPARNLPIALWSSIALTTVLYILIQIVALGTLPSLASSSTPLASAGRVFLGSAGAVIITAGAILSTIGSSSALALVGPRILYAMAEGGHLPRPLARIHARHRTPHVSIVVFAIIAWGMALYSDFTQLVAVSAIARLLFSASTCLAIPVLRRRMPLATRRFRVPGGIVIPALATAISIWLLSGINRAQATAGVIALAVGAILGLLMTRRSGE
jgi:amino acid transporter